MRRVRSRGRVFGLSVSLFVCLFVRHFLACSRVQYTFKSSLYSKQVDQVKGVSIHWTGTLDWTTGLE